MYALKELVIYTDLYLQCSTEKFKHSYFQYID